MKSRKNGRHAARRQFATLKELGAVFGTLRHLVPLVIMILSVMPQSQLTIRLIDAGLCLMSGKAESCRAILVPPGPAPRHDD